MSTWPTRAELDAAIRSHAIMQGQDQIAVTKVGVMLDALYGKLDRFEFWLVNQLANTTGAEWDVLNRVREAWDREQPPSPAGETNDG